MAIINSRYRQSVWLYCYSTMITPTYTLLLVLPPAMEFRLHSFCWMFPPYLREKSILGKINEACAHQWEKKQTHQQHFFLTKLHPAAVSSLSMKAKLFLVKHCPTAKECMEHGTWSLEHNLVSIQCPSVFLYTTWYHVQYHISHVVWFEVLIYPFQLIW